MPLRLGFAWAGLPALLLLLLWGCEKEVNTSLGQPPPGNRFLVDTIDTVQPVFFQYLRPALRFSDGEALSLASLKAGALVDSATGRTETRLSLSTDFSDDIFIFPDGGIDSGAIVLPLDNVPEKLVGDLEGNYTWEAFELREQLSGGWRTDQSLSVDTSRPIARYRGRLLDSSRLVLGLTEAGLNRFRRISDSIANESDLNLLNLFDGFQLRLRASEATAPGEGIMARFDLTGADLEAGIVFLQNGERQQDIELPINPSGSQRRATFRNNFSQTAVEALIGERVREVGYIKPQSALVLHVRFPGLADLRKQDTLLVQDARLRLPVRQPLSFQPPSQLQVLVGVDRPTLNESDTALVQGRLSSVGFGNVVAIWDSSRAEYILNLTERIQNQLEPSPNPGEAQPLFIHLGVNEFSGVDGAPVRPIPFDLRNKANGGGVGLRLIFTKAQP